MHCGACLWLLERLWRLDPGIVRSDVDLVRRTVRVTFRADRVSLRRIAECLNAVGYAPALDADRDAPSMPVARRALYLKIAVAGFAFGNAMLFSVPRYLNGTALDETYRALFGGLNLFLATGTLLFSASGYFTAAARALRHRAITLDVPVALGLAALFGRTVVDITLGRGEGFADSFTGLVFFLLIGRLFQQHAFDRIAFDRSFRSFLPLAVHVEQSGGETIMPIDRLRPGDTVVLRPGEVVPADARLLSGPGSVDASLITGEDLPVMVEADDAIAAGSRVVGRAMRMVLTSDVAHSRLVALWGRARVETSPPDALSDLAGRFGLGFTGVALAIAAVGAWAWWPDAGQAVSVATAVLIIACPCALTLAAPLTLGTAMSALGRRGIYLRQPGVALALGRVSAIAFDKTGTLTSKLTVEGGGSGVSAETLRLVQALAGQSIHPASRCIAAIKSELARAVPETVREIPGAGLRGRVEGHDVVIGSAAFVSEHAADVPWQQTDGVAVGIDGRFAGSLPLGSMPRPGVDEALEKLSKRYVTLLLSGDGPIAAGRWHDAFGDRARFRQSPEDKCMAVRAVQRAGYRVAMVGDGLNDAEALGTAEVGIAVSDDTACVVPACDAVIAGERVRDLPAILAFTHRARQVIVACFVVSVLYNILGLSLALGGSLTPLVAAVLMPVSSLTIVGMSIGLTRWFARGLPA
jgi:P-type Cu+ transporter